MKTLHPMKKRLSLFLLFLSMMVLSCSKDENNTNENASITAKIIVFSDPHYFDPSLGASGAAFENYLVNDRKLIAESDAIMQELVSQILSSDAKIVVVPGDLTKDGEKICHEKFALYLKQLKDAGKIVIVAPGNHDVNNPNSVNYVGDGTRSIPNISPIEFKQIYNDYGYGSAYAKDSNSLSYAVEPIKGVVFIVMDALKYGVGSWATSGKFSESTFAWTLNQIAIAKAQNKTVFGVNTSRYFRTF